MTIVSSEKDELFDWHPYCHTFSTEEPNVTPPPQTLVARCLVNHRSSFKRLQVRRVH